MKTFIGFNEHNGNKWHEIMNKKIEELGAIVDNRFGTDDDLKRALDSVITLPWTGKTYKVDFSRDILQKAYGVEDREGRGMCKDRDCIITPEIWLKGQTLEEVLELGQIAYNVMLRGDW